jgi:hypothetical protein
MKIKKEKTWNQRFSLAVVFHEHSSSDNGGAQPILVVFCRRAPTATPMSWRFISPLLPLIKIIELFFSLL